MAVYGVDFYGLSRYGSDSAAGTGLSVAPFNAVQFDFGTILLSWTTPTAAWTTLRIVRNLHGFPTDENDGDIVVETTASAPVTQFLDTGLIGGRFYYYSAFIGAAPPNWITGFTYLQNEYVTFSGAVYRAVKNNVSIQPGTDPTAWVAISTVTTQWYQAEGVSSLSVRDAGYADFTYALIPGVYKGTDGSPSDDPDDNDALNKFIKVFSFQFDTVRSEYDSLLNLNSADDVEQSNLPSLAADLGVTLEPYVTPRLARMRVKTASFTHRQRGSAQGLRNLINVTTGWDCEIDAGANLLLTRDQAAFDHPLYKFWSAEVNYPVGSLVSYSSRVYTCILGAYGVTNAPSGTTGANTWWTCVNAASAANYMGAYDATRAYVKNSFVLFNAIYYKALQAVPVGTAPTGLATDTAWWQHQTAQPTVLAYGNPDTGGYNTWGMVTFGAVTVDPTRVSLLAGNINPLVPTDFTGNSLLLTNSSGSSGTIGLRSLSPKIGATTPDRGQVIKDGIPVPSDYKHWTSSTTFHAGDVVRYGDSLYQALVTSLNVTPTSHPFATTSVNSSWLYLAPIGQRAFVASAYANVLTGVGVQATTFMEWYDEDGNLLDQVVPPVNTTLFDDFAVARAILGSTTTDGTVTWTSNSAWLGRYGYAYMDPTAVAQPNNRLAYVATGRANGNVGITFRTGDTAGFQHGIAFRISDASNYWFATRDWLGKCVAGVITYVTSWPTLPDNTRIIVNMNGSTITVSQYVTKSASSAWTLSTLATKVDAFNSTATNHGIYERNQTP